MDYEEGQPIPEGYAVATKSRTYIAAIGGGILALGYIPALYAAGLLYAARVDGIEPLFAPVVGPFITLETAEVEKATGVIALMGLGMVQTAGAVTAIVGLALPDEKQLYKARPSLTVTPTFGDRGPAGLAVTGTF